MIRFYAVFYALWFGILPSFCYEDKPHYSCSYREHLVENLKYAWRWLTWSETQEDREFEKRVNSNG